MGELLIQLAERFTSFELIAAFGAAALGLVAFIRLLGEAFLRIGGYGKLANQDDWFDSAGSWLQVFALGIGKGLSWLGIGNKK